MIVVDAMNCRNETAKISKIQFTWNIMYNYHLINAYTFCSKLFSTNQLIQHALN